MPGGSQEMIDDGCLQNVDKIYGTHLWSGYPSGTIYSRPGAIMASPDEFSVTIYGKGGQVRNHTKQSTLLSLWLSLF